MYSHFIVIRSSRGQVETKLQFNRNCNRGISDTEYKYLNIIRAMKQFQVTVHDTGPYMEFQVCEM
jgi:hypothetical protein